MPPPRTIEVRDAEGQVLRFPFDVDRVIVGRGADAAVRLDHGMVSRHHAEFTNDTARGQIRLKDLGSRNGTLVNGAAIAEHVLEPGEVVTIGPFRLSVQGMNFDRSRRARILADTSGTRFSRITDHHAPRVDAALLTTLSEFSQALLIEPDTAARERLLCQLLVNERFRGRWAAVVRSPLAGDRQHEEAPLVRSEASPMAG